MPEPSEPWRAVAVRLVFGSLALVTCFYILVILNLYVLDDVLSDRLLPAPTGPFGASLFMAASFAVLAFIWIATFRPSRTAKFQFSLLSALTLTLTVGTWLTLNTRVTEVRAEEREIEFLQSNFSDRPPWNWTPETRILSVTHRYRGWPLQWDWLIYEIDKPADGKTTTLSIPPDPEDPEFYQLGNLFVCAAMLIIAWNLSLMQRVFKIRS